MKPARLHAHDDVHLLVPVGLEHEVDRLLVGGRVLEQRRDVVEQDAGLREVGDLADLRAKRLGGHWGSEPPGTGAVGGADGVRTRRIASLPQPIPVFEAAKVPTRPDARTPSTAAPIDSAKTAASAGPRPSGPVRVPAAMMAPATPAPSAVPRMSLSCSDDDALPCSFPSTPRRTTSVTAEYMNPMPIPGIAQVRMVSSGGAPAMTRAG